MPAKKYLALQSGRTKQVAAVVVSAGAANDGDLLALDPSGRADASAMPLGFGQNTITAIASEALAAGDLVNTWNNAGVLNVRKADATAEGKECHGFVKSAFASLATATVFTSGNILTGLTGLTPSFRQYLHTTPGARSETPPAGTGNVVQMLGTAAGATSMIFEPEEPITV